jgi:pimeloyl-ACP methyl ester carboxylesterase
VHATELSRLAVPVLAIWGDTDALLTPAAGRADLDAIPGSELVVIAGGHAPWLNDLDRVGTAVGAFLAG